MGNLEKYSDQAALVGRLFYSLGLLMLVGYQTRLVALGLGIYVLITAFIAHSQLGDPNNFQHFMKNMAIVGGSLAFVAFGGGAYSLDARKP